MWVSLSGWGSWGGGVFLRDSDHFSAPRFPCQEPSPFGGYLQRSSLLGYPPLMLPSSDSGLDPNPQRAVSVSPLAFSLHLRPLHLVPPTSLPYSMGV